MTTPRINKAYLPRYVGKNVRLVGRVTNVNTMKKTVVIETSDKQKVIVSTAKCEDGEHALNSITEIIGQVLDDLTIEEFNAVDFTSNFDLENFDQLVHLSHMYPDLFGTVTE